MNRVEHIGDCQLILGDCRDVLARLPDKSVHCCVTSPPYFGLRDYGVDGQMGLEETPDAYVAGMVEVFREVRRVLHDDGTVWLNLGDSYAGSGKGGNPDGGKQSTNVGSQSVGCLYGTGKTQRDTAVTNVTRKTHEIGMKPKDLIGIPWRVAFALQADGWYLRQDIIWAKPNPMPESVTDRCTKAHEYIFMLSKQARYYYDQDAIKEGMAESSIARLSQDVESQVGSLRVPGKTNGPMRAVGGRRSDKQRGHCRRHAGFNDRWDAMSKEEQALNGRNKRSVWTVSTKPFKEAHFATFPPDLIEPCILAGCPIGGTVLDPFGGSGTTGAVAAKHGRASILIELNPDYLDIAAKRITEASAQPDIFIEAEKKAEQIHLELEPPHD